MPTKIYFLSRRLLFVSFYLRIWFTGWYGIRESLGFLFPIRWWLYLWWPCCTYLLGLAFALITFYAWTILERKHVFGDYGWRGFLCCLFFYGYGKFGIFLITVIANRQIQLVKFARLRQRCTHRDAPNSI